MLPVSGVAALSNNYSAASRYPAYLAPHGLHFYQAGEVLIYISLSYLYQAGEVLITHVPPRGVLDRCSSGDLGGCSVLRVCLRGWVGVWVCGCVGVLGSCLVGRYAIARSFFP